MTRPLFSTIIPVYNRARLATSAIDSALAQSRSDQEIIVVDDGSTDDTVPVLHERYGDRIRLLQQPNAGPGPGAIPESRPPAGRTSRFSTATIAGFPGRWRLIGKLQSSTGSPRSSPANIACFARSRNLLRQSKCPCAWRPFPTTWLRAIDGAGLALPHLWFGGMH